jgi:hypothetical protein
VAEIAIGLFWAVVVYLSGEVVMVLWVDYDPASVPRLAFPQLPKGRRRRRRRPNRPTVVIIKFPKRRPTRRGNATRRAKRHESPSEVKFEGNAPKLGNEVKSER